LTEHRSTMEQFNSSWPLTKLCTLEWTTYKRKSLIAWETWHELATIRWLATFYFCYSRPK